MSNRRPESCKRLCFKLALRSSSAAQRTRITLSSWSVSAPARSDQHIPQGVHCCSSGMLARVSYVPYVSRFFCVQVGEDVIEQLKGIIDCSRHGEDFYGSDASMRV